MRTMIARAHRLLIGKTVLAGLAFWGHFAHAQQTLAGVPVEKPVPGFLTANISNHRTLRYRCAGRGTPTVLVEQGMGISVETTFSWKETHMRVTREIFGKITAHPTGSSLTTPATISSSNSPKWSSRPFWMSFSR
jgi:hypothetical protein